MYGAFVWACRALNGPFRRFPARADDEFRAAEAESERDPTFGRRPGRHDMLKLVYERVQRANAAGGSGGRAAELRERVLGPVQLYCPGPPGR